jgi:sirohydrochlorin cobaltochelatase
MIPAKLILLAHGSRDPRWRLPFEVLITQLKESIGQERLDLAYMEFCSPSLRDVIESSYKDGFSFIKILPLFMAGGAHLHDDVPVILKKIEEDYEGLEIKILPPIGESPQIVNAIKEITISEISVLSINQVV